MIKIKNLQIENVKRVHAVELEPKENGLTVIGGKNGQGKTTVLDAIAWALCGKKYQPTNAKNDDSVLPPNLKVTLSNGLVVERTGTNSTLKVTDPNGAKSGQALLDSFVDELAVNLPKFMNSNNKEKANVLLQIIGVGDELAKLELKEKSFYQDRLYKGREVEQKKGFIKEMKHFDDLPSEQISVAELLDHQKNLLDINAKNDEVRKEYKFQTDLVDDLKNQYALIKEKLDSALAKEKELLTAVGKLEDQDLSQINTQINEVESKNAQIALNQRYNEACEELEKLQSEYNEFDIALNDIRKEKISLLDNADLPLPDLGIENSELTYKGKAWDSMSGSEQLKVATAIVRKLNPKCGFVLIDKLEQMDLDTLSEFGQWLEKEQLQAIATRVSTGDECSIIIEDGYVKGEDKPSVTSNWGKEWGSHEDK